MAKVSALGQFLSSEDLNQTAIYASVCYPNLEQCDKDLITKILDSNWNDEEQMVSNLLQFPILIPNDLQIKFLLKALNDYNFPYYMLSAAVGIQRLKFNDADLNKITSKLKSVVLCEYGTVAMRAFISLQPFLNYPSDVDLFLEILKMKKTSLHEIAISWLVLHVDDKKELVELLQNNNINKNIVEEAKDKMESHCQSLCHGEPSPVSIELFDFIPNLNDFEAMLAKEDTLAEFFEDLDTDEDDKISADQVKTFLEDIGQDVKMEEIIEEMKKIGIDKEGLIDCDGFVEMMFPKFHMQ